MLIGRNKRKGKKMEERDFVLSVMAKVTAPNVEEAYDRLYELLCIPGDIGFSINEYAVISDKDSEKIKFVEVSDEE